MMFIFILFLDKVKKAMLSSRNVKFGGFLATLAAGFKVHTHTTCTAPSIELTSV